MNSRTEPASRPDPEASRGPTVRRFVIYAPDFNETRGGAIALHRLCDRLNALGYESYIWPYRKPRFTRVTDLGFWKRQARWLVDPLRGRAYKTNPAFVTPIASHRLLRDAVVLYPESVDGNPLRARRVVRWLLHRPGYITGRPPEYGDSEIFFHYQRAFAEGFDRESTLLSTRWVRDDVYRITNHGPREGACHLVRKAKRRDDIDPDAPEFGPRVDGMSHEQMAKTFNEKKYFYSFDPYTMYCVYAALCGCIPVIVPLKGVSREAWQARPEDRYGRAYGIEDEAWAVETRELLRERLRRDAEEEVAMIHGFARRCAETFPENDRP